MRSLHFCEIDQLASTTLTQKMSVDVLLVIAQFRQGQHWFPQVQRFADQLVPRCRDQRIALDQIALKVGMLVRTEDDLALRSCNAAVDPRRMPTGTNRFQ